MKDMMFEFFNMKQKEQISVNQAAKFTPRGYNLNHFESLGNLGLCD